MKWTFRRPAAQDMSPKRATPTRNAFRFRPNLERFEDRWVPSALAIKLEWGAGFANSAVVQDNGPGDLDPTANQITVNSGVGGVPAIPGLNVQGEIALSNTPGSATAGAMLGTSFQISAVGNTGATVRVTTSATGYTQPTGGQQTLISTLDGNGNGSGTITAQGWVDSTNTQFGMGANTPGSQGPFAISPNYHDQSATTFAPSALYALTSQFTATVGADSNTSGTVQETEPGSTTPPPPGTGSTATIGFWNNKNGQAVIKSLNSGPNATDLGNWLATNFPNLYGGLAGQTNTQIASYDQTLFGQNGLAKTYAQILANALAMYVTSTVTNNTNAGQVLAGKYGFKITAGGTGGALYDLGAGPTVIGLTGKQTVFNILKAIDNLGLAAIQANLSAINGITDGINEKFDI